MPQRTPFSVSTESGFTLVELMISVAIVGLLVSMAKTNYDRLVRRAQQTEAKVLLSGMYTAEQTFQVEYGGYTTRFDVLGFLPSGRVRYNVGFGMDLPPPPDAPQGTINCGALCPGGPPTCDPPDKPWQCTAAASWGTGPDASSYGSATQDTFLASAHTHFVPNEDRDEDTWTINQNKTFVNIVGPK